MAEMYVNVYFRHEDPEVHGKLVQLFETGDAGDDSSRQPLIDLATEINPEKGEGIARAFLRNLDEKIYEMFSFEEVADLGGYCCAGGTYGGGGDRFVARCVKFLYHLCPGIQALAWGMGDDDPWEFWFKHENGHLVRHDAEPFDGNDNRIRSTIYRWWHDGLPGEIREGMLNDSDDEGEDDYDDSEPVTEEEYQQWISAHAEGSDIVDDVEEVVMDEIVGAFTNALGSLFSGGAVKKTVSPDAFDADVLDDAVVRRVIDDIDACARAFDVDGVLKHISQSLKGKVTTTVDGEECTMPLSHSLYRMSLKLVLKEDAEYENEQEVLDIQSGESSATVTTTSAVKFIDPETRTRMNTTTEDVFTLGIVDGKVQVMSIASKEIASCPA